jgi:hypothetical protein
MDYKKISAGAAIFAVVLLAGSFSVSAFSGNGEGNRKHMMPEEVIEAINNVDYTAWAEATSDHKGRLSDVINADNFTQFASMHQLKMAGELEEARAIAKELGIGGQKHFRQKHVMPEEVIEAINNVDYTAWAEATSDRGGRLSEIINEDNFAQFASMHQLIQSGEFEEAKVIAKELGIDGKGHFKIMKHRQDK